MYLSEKLTLTRILILAPYPWNEAPSQRFRFELLSKNTEEKGLAFSFASFYSTKGWKRLYHSTHSIGKLWLLVVGFARRKLHLIKAINHDIILIHRELTPIGPPIFEWLIAKVLRKKIIFDYDDAIWMNDGHDGKLSWILKSRWKIRMICRWSWKVSAGNEFLADFARQYCDQVVVIPTVVDTNTHNRKIQESISGNNKLTIGWTGSHSTLFYLNEVLPILAELQKTIDFTFLVIANKNPELPLRNYRFVKWNKETEVDDLQQIDIGIMPLEDTAWARGKCGFKLIQYGAIGIPAVASPVGVNQEVIDDGHTGFLATLKETWNEKLLALLTDETLRLSMGLAARQKIEKEYAADSIKQKFVDLFNS